MGEVTIRVPGLLARFTDGERTISVRADTAKECIDRLLEAHPALEPHLLDGQGQLRVHIQLFVDGRNVEWSDRERVALEAGSNVTILQAVSGG